MRARTASLLWAIAALAASACLTPNEPGAGDVAELKVRASFAAGAEPDAMGVTVDSATVVAAPTSGEPATVDTTVAVTDLDSALSWIVDLSDDSIDYAVHMELRGGGQALYQGDDDVLLRRLPLGDAPVFDVPVAYVGPGAIARVIVTPGSVTLTSAGAQQSFTAQAQDADGKSVNATFAWSTSDAAVATIDEVTGVATAVTTGAATITATASGVAGTADLDVALGGLVVEIAPASATIPALNATAQFTATARDGSGTPLQNATFSWATRDAAIATVDQGGLATAVAEGSTKVWVETGGVADTADLLVAVAATVDVSPTSATLSALGATRQFTAVARKANGDTIPGVTFAWSSSAPAVATVDSTTGLAIAASNGTTTIGAMAGNATGTASLTVDQAIVAVVVTPASATLATIGASQQFTAVARDANGNPVSTTFAWTSSASAVATVDPTTGLATAVAGGQTTITAATGALSASAQLIVAPGGLVVQVSPDSATLTALGATQQFTAVAQDGNGDPIADAAFQWTARDPSIAAVDSTGLATAVAEGTTWVVATFGGEADSAKVRVAVATSVAVTPATVTLTALGATQQFAATARDANGAVIQGARFTWTSGDSTVARVDSALGVATAVTNGTTTVTARTGNASGAANVTVSQAVAGIAVTPLSATLAAVGATRQFSATALDANGNAVTRPVTFSWSSSDPGIATVDSATGLATAVANGTASILARAEGATGGASLTIQQVVVTVAVAPATVSFTAFGDAQTLSATGYDANGHPVPGATFDWGTSDASIASVDGTGLVTAVGNGDASVTASAGGVTDGAAVQVNQAVAAISVTPSTSTLTSVNETVQLAAAARDANDHPVTRPVTFAWSSDQTGVATVDATTGLVTAAGQGTATITAAAEGKSGTASVSVELAGYANWATITADPTGVEANNDDPSTITVRLFDSNGDPLGTSGGTVELSTTLGTLTTVVDLGDGTYTASVRSGVSGTAIVSGTLDGAPIADTAGVRFSTAAERATITADPTEVVANSDIPSVITVQLYNPDGTPRTTSGGTVQLLTNLGTMSSVTDLGNGSYSANLWSTVEGTALVTGTLNGVQIADSAQVLFTSPPPTITTIEVTPDTATLTVLGMTLQYTAVAKDASGNVVPNVLFTWFSSDTTVATIDATGVATAVADGHTTITAQSGSVTGSATLRVCTVTSAGATGGSAAPPVCQ